MPQLAPLTEYFQHQSTSEDGKDYYGLKEIEMAISLTPPRKIDTTLVVKQRPGRQGSTNFGGAPDLFRQLLRKIEEFTHSLPKRGPEEELWMFDGLTIVDSDEEGEYSPTIPFCQPGVSGVPPFASGSGTHR